MTIGWLHLVLLATVPYAPVGAQPATAPAATRPAWDPSPFSYKAPEQLAVEEATPRADQLAPFRRPPQIPADAPDPVARHAAPGVFGGMNVLSLRFRDSAGEILPALLCTPRQGKGPFPLVIAVHGLRSNKAAVCGQVGPDLTRLGFAVLAFDLPLHGERLGDTPQGLNITELGRIANLCQHAVIDVRQCIDLATTRPELDTSHGVGFVGYSMGSWIGSMAGPADDRIKAMVLMVGGAYEYPRILNNTPQLAACDPRNSIPHFSPRPLLLLNGSHDHIIKPEVSRNLFNAAAEPKEQRWFDSDHLLPARAYSDAADFIKAQLPTAPR